MRDRRVISDASVCEQAEALRDPAVRTVADVLARGTQRCPVFTECSSGRLLGPGKLNCIARQGQEVARNALRGGVSIAVEMGDFRKAPFFPPAARAFIDPYDDPQKEVTDKDAICAAVETWATDIAGEGPSTTTPLAAGIERVLRADQTEIVMPGGIPKVVPRNRCRCPILQVGDFCPVHGG